VHVPSAGSTDITVTDVRSTSELEKTFEAGGRTLSDPKAASATMCAAPPAGTTMVSLADVGPGSELDLKRQFKAFFSLWVGLKAALLVSSTSVCKSFIKPLAVESVGSYALSTVPSPTKAALCIIASELKRAFESARRPTAHPKPLSPARAITRTQSATSLSVNSASPNHHATAPALISASLEDVTVSSSATDTQLHDPSKARQRRLANFSEQRALKAGMLHMQEQLVSNPGVDVTNLPAHIGARKTLGAFFLARLLGKRIELKSCMESDVCAAQPDIRHLNLAQLLSIRTDTLDLQAESASHSARNSFLETVDRHLFEKLARECSRGEAALPTSWKPLHALGIRIALTVGVARMLMSGSGDKVGTTGSALDIPVCWALELDEQDWPDGCRAAILNVAELWVEPLLGRHPDFSVPAAGGLVAVIRDRSKGKDLNWEISVLDSRIDDVLAKMTRVRIKPSSQKLLASELSALFIQRASCCNSTTHGSSPDSPQVSTLPSPTKAPLCNSVSELKRAFESAGRPSAHPKPLSPVRSISKTQWATSSLSVNSVSPNHHATAPSLISVSLEDVTVSSSATDTQLHDAPKAMQSVGEGSRSVLDRVRQLEAASRSAHEPKAALQAGRAKSSGYTGTCTRAGLDCKDDLR